MGDLKKYCEITPEEIADLYASVLEEDEKKIFDLMGRYSCEILGGRSFSDVTSDVKTVALHTHFTGWKTGHWSAILAMAEELIEAGYTVYLLHHTLPPASAVESTKAKMIKLPDYGEDRETAISTINAIEEVCQTYEIDAVVFNHYFDTIKYIDHLAFKRVKLLHTDKNIRCLLQFHSSFQREFSAADSIGSDWLTNNAACVGVFDSLIVEGHVDGRFWSAFNPNVFFRPLPVNEDVKAMPVSALESRDIVYLARFSLTKNQGEVIEAMEKVVKEVPDARLIFLGDGWQLYFDRCKELAQEKGLQDKVLFPGYITGEEKNEYLRNAGIAVSASRFEGYSIALAECKAHGLPIVMYDIPNLIMCEGGEANGTITVPQHDTEGMADALIDLLTDDERRKELGARARAHMERLYDVDYPKLWEQMFKAKAKSNEYIEDEIHQKVYNIMLDSFAVTYRNAVTKINELEEKIELLKEDKNLTVPETEAQEAEQQEGAPNYVISRGTIKMDAPANGFMDRYILFNAKFNKKPHVVCSMYTSAEDPDIANLTCTAINVSTNGCVLRVFNNSDTSRTPAVTYIAVGE